MEQRSEEHTSELQSQSNIVCRLLLEKKKLKRRRGQPLGTNGKARQPNPDTRKKHRVGENLDSEEIDENRGMTDPGRRYFGVVPLQRLRFGKGRSNRAPTFDCPFTPKMPKPTPDSPAVQSRLFRCVHALAHRLFFLFCGGPRA